MADRDCWSSLSGRRECKTPDARLFSVGGSGEFTPTYQAPVCIVPDLNGGGFASGQGRDARKIPGQLEQRQTGALTMRAEMFRINGAR